MAQAQYLGPLQVDDVANRCAGRPSASVDAISDGCAHCMSGCLLNVGLSTFGSLTTLAWLPNSFENQKPRYPTDRRHTKSAQELFQKFGRWSGEKDPRQTGIFSGPARPSEAAYPFRTLDSSIGTPSSHCLYSLVSRASAVHQEAPLGLKTSGQESALVPWGYSNVGQLIRAKRPFNRAVQAVPKQKA